MAALQRNRSGKASLPHRRRGLSYLIGPHDNLNRANLAPSGQVQSPKSIFATFQQSEKMMTQFERQILGLVMIAATLFAALTWRLFASI